MYLHLLMVSLCMHVCRILAAGRVCQLNNPGFLIEDFVTQLGGHPVSQLCKCWLYANCGISCIINCQRIVHAS